MQKKVKDLKPGDKIEQGTVIAISTTNGIIQGEIHMVIDLEDDWIILPQDELIAVY